MEERLIRTEMLLGEAAMGRLARAHVAVFGLGGVGSWCAEALARCGVGALTLIDEDAVAESNLNRQVEALSSTIGESKAEAMARRVLDIAPGCRVTARAERYEAERRGAFFPAPWDYIADCIDLVACKLDLIEAAQAGGIPIISALGTGNKLDLSRLRIADVYGTDVCPLARVMRRELRRRGVERLTVVFSDEPPTAPSQPEAPPPGRRSVPGSAVWVPAAAGLLMAQHIALSIAKEDER